MSEVNAQYLAKSPKFIGLIPRILCKKNIGYQLGTSLPDTSIWLKNVKFDANQMASFNQTVDWQQPNILHPGYLHTLAFPIQLKLMLQQSFPFSIIGLVHVQNKIEQSKPVRVNDKVDICCKFGELVKQAAGVSFTINSTFYVDNICVLSAQHQYLKREIRQNKPTRSVTAEQVSLATTQSQLWSLSSALGRQYARCSADYNPIHLHPLSAKLFGFKRHIIHGMWLKSRIISALCNQQEAIFNSSFSCEVEFKKPLYLPNVVRFHKRIVEQEQTYKGFEFKVISDNNNLPVEHMSGRLLF
jgi:acyl dehydratase